MLTCAKRLRKELQEQQRESENHLKLVQAARSQGTRVPPQDIILTADEGNLRSWRGSVLGPPDTPFEGYRFSIHMSVPESYPLSPPVVRLQPGAVFHPNVHFKTGEVCLDILKPSSSGADGWSPAWDLRSVARAVRAMLECPNPDSPLNCDAGNMLRPQPKPHRIDGGGASNAAEMEIDDRAYRSMARMFAREYAERDMSIELPDAEDNL